MADEDRSHKQLESDRYNAQGIEAADRKWLDEAVHAFKRAIELDPESAHAHDNLATVYSEQKKYRLALREYLEALRLEPDSPTAHYNLACFLSSQGQEMAVDEYRAAIRLEQDYPDAHVNLGLCHVAGGNHQEAIEEFRIACELDPDDLGARQELAASLIDIGEYADAIRHLKEVVRAEPQNLDALVDLGIACCAQGFYDEAERAFCRAQELDESEVLAPYHLAALYASWERQDDALGELEKAVRLDPERVRAWVDTDRMFDVIRTTPTFVEIFRSSDQATETEAPSDKG